MLHWREFHQAHHGTTSADLPRNLRSRSFLHGEAGNPGRTTRHDAASARILHIRRERSGSWRPARPDRAPLAPRKAVSVAHRLPPCARARGLCLVLLRHLAPGASTGASVGGGLRHIGASARIRGIRLRLHVAPLLLQSAPSTPGTSRVALSPQDWCQAGIAPISTRARREMIPAKLLRP
jgi:hypothetical protein